MQIFTRQVWHEETFDGTQMMNNFVRNKENLPKVDCEMPTLYPEIILFIVRIYSFNSNLLFSISLRMRFTKIKQIVNVMINLLGTLTIKPQPKKESNKQYPINFVSSCSRVTIMSQKMQVFVHVGFIKILYYKAWSYVQERQTKEDSLIICLNMIL